MAQRKIKIRFIEIEGKRISYKMQRKTFFGWTTYGSHHGGGAGDSVWISFTENSKEELMNTVLSEIYGTTKEFTRVTEYPMLRQY